jgi:starch synthase/alpha-amylase
MASALNILKRFISCPATVWPPRDQEKIKMEDSMMPNPSNQPRILFITADAAFTPEWTGSRPEFIRANSEGFGDFPVKLISVLLDLAADVHVAQPDYRKIFAMLSRNEQTNSGIKLPIDRAHLAEDRAFFYSNPVYCNSEWENIRISLSFQREVINQIVPRVEPDLIHCHDWMTGLIPAMAKNWGIPCIFTVSSLRSAKSSLSSIEDRGIDGASFWQHLFYDRYPSSYEETRDTNPLDFLLSGILAARHVSTTSFALMSEIFESQRAIFYSPLRNVLAQKWNAVCAGVIPDTFNPPFNPASPETLYDGVGSNDQIAGMQKKNHVIRQRPFSFDERSTAQRYIDLYETILQRPLVAPEPKKVPTIMKNDRTRISDGQAIPHRMAQSKQPDRIPHERISTPAMVLI